MPGFVPAGKQGAATAPVVQPSSSVLVPGEPATLECTPPLGAQPGANAYEWYKNGKKLEGSGSKITFNADVTSGGDYSCGYHLPGTSSLISSVPVPLKSEF